MLYIRINAIFRKLKTAVDIYWQKQETVASLNIEIASSAANIDSLKVDLKEKKTEAESVVKRLLASGMSADEILEKLK